MIGRKEKVSYIAVDTMPSLIDAREGPTNIPSSPILKHDEIAHVYATIKIVP